MILSRYLCYWGGGGGGSLHLYVQNVTKIPCNFILAILHVLLNDVFYYLTVLQIRSVQKTQLEDLGKQHEEELSRLKQEHSNNIRNVEEEYRVNVRFISYFIVRVTKYEISMYEASTGGPKKTIPKLTKHYTDTNDIIGSNFNA